MILEIMKYPSLILKSKLTGFDPGIFTINIVEFMHLIKHD